MNVSKLISSAPIILVLSALLTACSTLGKHPDYEHLAEQDTMRLETWSQISSDTETTYLNELLDSPVLEEILGQAMENNPELQQTLLALDILQSQYLATRATQLPTVDAALSGSKTEGANADYTGSVTVSWELDLWSRLANETSAAANDVAEQQALYQYARDTLAAEVMQSWLKLINLNQAIAIEEQRVDLLERNEQWILQRYRSGMGDLEDLDSARSTAASARSTLIGLKESLQQQQRAMNLLLGRSQGSTVIASDYPEVLVPLADLPNQTLQRRPDLKAAYAAIKASDLRTSVAYKEMLPSINLEAALSDTGTSPGDALLRNPVWSLLGQLTAPLFRGGELRANAEAAELATAQSYQAYRETLLTAVKEVENAISRESSLGAQREQIEIALSSAHSNFKQYQQKYRNGLVSVLDLLEVQQSAFDLESQLNDLTYERLGNRVTLGLALGLGIKETDQR